MDCQDELIATPTYKKLKATESLGSIWTGQTFEVFKLLGSRKKGAVAEKLVEDMLKVMGFTVGKSKGLGGDRTVQGLETEIKASCCWDEVPDAFCWQQLRRQDYARVIFLGVNPASAVLYWADKEALVKEIFNDSHRQHAGRKGGQELYWIQVGPDGNQVHPLPACFNSDFSSFAAR